MSSMRKQVPALRAMVPDRLWSRLEAAIEASMRSGTGAAGVYGILRDLHLPEHERQMLTLAYSLWRGVGPAVEVQDLWGMDAATARMVLVGIACSVSPTEGQVLLRSAADLVEQLRWEDAEAEALLPTEEEDTQSYEAEFLRLATAGYAK